MDLDAMLDRLALEPGCSVDAAEVALHLARDEYPELDVPGYLAEIAAMAHEARAYARGGLEARVTGLCRYLFHEMGFRGNVRDYYDPRNSYLNQVLDRRTGIPLTLSLVAMVVGQRAGLAVAGVGLPGHFIAKASDGQQEILFDPFHGGRLLTPTDCEHLVNRSTGLHFEITAASLEALPLRSIVQRMLNNLKANYLEEGDFLRAARVIERLARLDPADLLQRRDLGLSLLRGGRPGRAIDYLEAYLATEPTPGDANVVRRYLTQARGEVARWN